MGRASHAVISGPLHGAAGEAARGTMASFKTKEELARAPAPR